MIKFDGPLTVHELRQQLNECRPAAVVGFTGSGDIVAMVHDGTTVDLIGGKRAMNKAAAAERAARRGEVVGAARSPVFVDAPYIAGEDDVPGDDEEND